MSSDARVWQDDDGHWRGNSDLNGDTRDLHPFGLVELLQALEHEMGDQSMRWCVRTNPDGTVYLVGYCW